MVISDHVATKFGLPREVVQSECPSGDGGSGGLWQEGGVSVEACAGAFMCGSGNYGGGSLWGAFVPSVYPR